MARVRTGDGFQRIAARGRVPRPANPMLLRSLASFSPKPGVALAGLLPAGAIDASFIGDRVEELCGGSAWPSRDLWIVAVRLADGRRIVFGRDAVTSLGPAVAASCAIPGFFMPIRVDGRRHVDGGAHSPTNADVLRGLDLDLVVVSAPMAGRWRAVRANPTGMARTSSRMSLDREVATLRRGGTPVLVLQPGPEDAALMDGRAMDPSCRAPVAQRARQSALEYLARTQVPRPAP
jgi:NTE family protein